MSKKESEKEYYYNVGIDKDPEGFTPREKRTLYLFIFFTLLYSLPIGFIIKNEALISESWLIDFALTYSLSGLAALATDYFIIRKFINFCVDKSIKKEVVSFIRVLSELDASDFFTAKQILETLFTKDADIVGITEDQYIYLTNFYQKRFEKNDKPFLKDILRIVAFFIDKKNMYPSLEFKEEIQSVFFQIGLVEEQRRIVSELSLSTSTADESDGRLDSDEEIFTRNQSGS